MAHLRLQRSQFPTTTAVPFAAGTTRMRLGDIERHQRVGQGKERSVTRILNIFLMRLFRLFLHSFDEFAAADFCPDDDEQYDAKE